MTTVSLVHTKDRESGIGRAIDLLNLNPVSRKDVLLKPNFNTADPYPGSTHNDTLIHLVGKLKAMGAGGITVADRSGPASTADVLVEKGIPALAERFGFRVLNLEELPEESWMRFRTSEKLHWWRGFDVAVPVLEAPSVVTTCCLKTHGFGGVFTMTLKLGIGITHKRNMTELHSSFLNMEKMIAEVNLAYKPDLIVMDGIEAFVNGGPMTGQRKEANVLLAGTDRVAMDAVGVAVLKDLGTKKTIMEKRVFDQIQIARAAELGIGVSRPDEIQIVSDSPDGQEYAARLKQILLG